MSFVLEKAGNQPLDKCYSTHLRSNAGTPNAALTPLFAGEIVWDTVNKVRWRAVALTNADWTPHDVAEVT